MDDDVGCWVCLWRRVLMDMMIMTEASSYEGGNTNINSQLRGVARTHVLTVRQCLRGPHGAVR